MGDVCGLWVSKLPALHTVSIHNGSAARSPRLAVAEETVESCFYLNCCHGTLAVLGVGGGFSQAYSLHAVVRSKGVGAFSPN